MAYYFYLDDMMLPIPPAKMDIRIKNKNKTVNLINEGEINIIKTESLKEISFELLLPNSNYPFADYSQSDTEIGVSAFNNLFGGSIGILGNLLNEYSFKGAEHYLEKIKIAKESKQPLRLIIMRMTPSFEVLFDTNLLVTIENYSIREDAKNGFDVVVPLQLKEYKYYATKEVEVKTDENGKETYTIKENRPTDKITPSVWKVTKEKSVYEAVKLASGGSLNWRSVMNLNKMYNPSTPTLKEVLKLE